MVAGALFKIQKMRQHFSKAAAAIGHPLIFEAAVVVSFTLFSIYPGALLEVMRACSLVFIINLLIGNYRLSDFNKAAVLMVSGMIIMLLANVTAPDEVVHSRSLSYFIALPGTALAGHALAVRKIAVRQGYSSGLYTAVVGSAVILNAGALLFLQTDGRINGFYSNPHHLGLFASITLPALFFSFMLHNRWVRMALVGIILVDLLMLFESNSKVSWLAFMIGCGLPVFFFLRGRHRLFAIGGLILFSGFGAAIYGIPRLVNRLRFFLMHLDEEARWVIWTKAWELCLESSLGQWLFGHGIGSFRYYMTDFAYTSAGGKPIQFSFPHNGILQILFENGVVGCAVVFGGMLAIAMCLIKIYPSLKSENTRYMVITVFAAFLITLVHFMLTKSFYSKYIQYILSLIIGMTLALYDEYRAKRDSSPA
jgi:O-antigen ligase